jgi:hypothetical protein
MALFADRVRHGDPRILGCRHGRQQVPRWPDACSDRITVDGADSTDARRMTVGLVLLLSSASCASREARGMNCDFHRPGIVAQVGQLVATDEQSRCVPERSTEERTDGGDASSNSKGEVLKVLSACLAEVRSARKNAPLWKEGPKDVSALRGMTVSEIKGALGQPDCVADLSRPCPGNAALTYDLFYLPPGWKGGGATLLVNVDSNGRCESADWLWTK